MPNEPENNFAKADEKGRDPFASVRRWKAEQEEKAVAHKKAVDEWNEAQIKAGKDALVKVLELLGIPLEGDVIGENEFEDTDPIVPEPEVVSYRVYTEIQGYQFGLVAFFKGEKLEEFVELYDDNGCISSVVLQIITPRRQHKFEENVLINHTADRNCTLIDFVRKDAVFEFVYNVLFDDIPF